MKRLLSIAAAATLLSLLVAAPAGAAPTYHGTWNGDGAASFSDGCPFPTHSVDGNWNVTLLADGRAVVHYTTFEFGGHLMSVGGARLGELWQQLEPVDGQTFAVSTSSLGSTMTMTLTGEALTFLFTPYGPCEWGQAIGHLDH